MAAQKDLVICHVCGFKNAPDAERCVSCGAKLEEISGEYTEEEARRRVPRRQGFAFHWVIISSVVYLAVLGVLLIGIPFATNYSFDPQGLWALVISYVVFFIGGAL